MKLPVTHKKSASFEVAREGGLRRAASLMSSETPQKLPLSGGVEQFGEYFVEVEIGTPPQSIELQVDTGSTDLLVYGIGCDGCPSNADHYNYKASSTSNVIQCENKNFYCSSCDGSYCAFNDTYGDGSGVQGFIVNDTLTFIGGTPQEIGHVSLGSIETATPNFEPTGVDGIFGLASPATSSWSGQSPLIEYMEQNDFYMAFQMCLQYTQGFMTLGTNYHSNSFYQWADRIGDTYYSASLNDLKVNGTSLGLSSSVYNGRYGSLVDSGTTLMIFPSDVITQMKKQFMDVCNEYNLPGVCNAQPGKGLFDGYCYPMSSTDRANFPQLDFQFDSFLLPLSPASYLIANQGTYCLGVASFGNAPGTPGITILGDTFMRGFSVIFDIASSQIGFAPATQC